MTKGLSADREKALALHRFGMAHFIHFDGPIEERGEYVTDPMKLIAVYGYALCGNNSSAMNALYNAAGLKARKRSMPGHSVPEVWFEGKWNYIDTDMFGYVFLPDGKLASVDELARDADLFTRQKNPPEPFYPFDRKQDMAATFRNVNASRDCHPYANAHIMNLSLRTGESARLFFRPRGEGRYFLTPAFRPDLGTLYKDYWQVWPVRKCSLAWCDRPPAAYGNGLIEYAPDLRSSAFARENPDQANIAAGDGRNAPELVSRQRGETASLIVKVTTPWIIAGLQNDLTNFDDNTDAAVVSGLFWRPDPTGENRISVSRDAGRTWIKVWENRYLGAVPFRVDLTRWTDGEYGYWVKFEWQAGLEKLRAGSNTFRLDTAPLRAVYNQSRWDRAQSLPGQTLDNLTPQERIPYLQPADRNRPGILTFSPGTNGVVRELRVSLRARAARGSQGVSALLSLSEDAGANWRELARFSPDPEHTTNHMWFNHVLTGRAIDASRCRLRIEISGGGLEQVIANSLVAAEPAASTRLRLTHVWREGDRERTFTHLAPAAPRGCTYEVTAAAGLINNEVRIEGVAQ